MYAYIRHTKAISQMKNDTKCYRRRIARMKDWQRSPFPLHPCLTISFNFISFLTPCLNNDHLRRRTTHDQLVASSDPTFPLLYMSFDETRLRAEVRYRGGLYGIADDEWRLRINRQEEGQGRAILD